MSLMNFRKSKSSLARSMAFGATIVLAQSATAANEQEEFIPDDTMFYLGTGDPIPVEDIAAMSISATNPELAETLFAEQDRPDGAEGALFTFLADYTADPVAAFEKWGLGDELQLSIYSLGFLPVLRVTADAEKFEATLLEANPDSQARTKVIEHKGFEIKLLPVDRNSTAAQEQNQDSESSSSEPDGQPGPDENTGLIFAAVDDDVVIALATDASDPEYLDQLLGLNDSGQSLEESGKLEQIREDWNYGDGIAMYLDHQIFADTLTGGGNSIAAAQLENLAQWDNEIADVLEQFSSAICKTEITQLASIWPMFVSGVREFEVDDKGMRFDTHMAMLMTHQPLLDIFDLLGGFVPQLNPNSNAMLSMGLGVDVDTVPQLISQLTRLLGGLNYQCPLLQPLNELANSDLSSAAMGSAMVSGMARGIKGLSVSVFAGENNTADNTAGSIPYLDVLENAAIAISADDPQTLLSTLSALPQLEMLSRLPPDGTPVPLSQLAPIPLPVNNEIFAAVKDKSIVLYSGEEAKAVSENLSGIGEEAFFVSTINMRYFFDNMANTLEQIPGQQGRDENLDDMVTILESYPDGTLSSSLDFTEKGVEFEYIFETENPE